MNHLTRILGTGALACSLALALGCHGRPDMVPSIFQISKEREGAAIATAGNPATTGRLTVVISGFLGSLRQRRLLATVADVEQVTVTVTAAGGQVYSQAITKAAFSNGQVTATFTGLPIGNASVKMEAFDVNGMSLGANTRSVFVAAGQTSTVSVPLMIDPTVTVSPGSGGGSGSPPTPSGAVEVNGTLADAFEVAAYDLGASCEAIAADPRSVGGVWAATTGGPLKHLGADGGLLATLDVSATPWALAVDADGHLWLPSSAGASRFDPSTGNPAFSVSGATFLDRSPSGHVWSAIVAPPFAQSLARYNADGTVAQHAMPSQLPHDVAVAHDGSVWVTEEYSSADTDGLHNLIKFHPDGTEAFNVLVEFPAQGIDVDSEGNAWLARQFGLVKYSPTGEELGNFSDWSMADVLAASNGSVWALSEMQLHQFNSQGQEVGYLDLSPYGDHPAFDIGHLGSYLAEDGQGNIWLAWGTKLIKVSP